MTHVSVAAQTVLRGHANQVNSKHMKKKKKKDWKCVFLSGLSYNNILSNKIRGETKKKKRKKFVVCFCDLSGNNKIPEKSACVCTCTLWSAKQFSWSDSIQQFHRNFFSLTNGAV